MTSLTIEKHVAAPREEVFRVASDLPNAADVVSGIERIEMLTEGPVRVGTRWRETRRFGKREATEELEITGFDPPRSYSAGCHSFGCRFHSEFRFEEADGGTKVVLTFEAKPESIWAKAMGFFAKPMIAACAKACRQDLDDLARACESSSGAPSGAPAGWS